MGCVVLVQFSGLFESNALLGDCAFVFLGNARVGPKIAHLVDVVALTKPQTPRLRGHL